MTTPLPLTEAERVRIARFEGWTASPCTAAGQPAFVARTPEGETLWRSWSGQTEDEGIARCCPSYESLDHCREFEKRLTEQQRRFYEQVLIRLLGTYVSEEVSELSDFDLLHASALQRSRALLKLIDQTK
jgi:hypothetical protein